MTKSVCNFEIIRYIYNYTDQLGNVRLSYQNNGSGAAVLEENNYYPFGLKHYGYNSTSGNPDYRYQYNGKELQDDTGMLDYGWRQYMPELGRWNGMDQLSEIYSSYSPYAYVMNNPVMMYDPDGRISQDWLNGIYNMSRPGKTTYSQFSSNGMSAWANYESLPFGEASRLYSLIDRGGSDYITWWTGGALGDANTAQEMVGHMLRVGNSLMGFVEKVDSYAKAINEFPAVEFPGLLEKHYNGALGYLEMGVKTYNKIPNDFKRKVAFKLSKILPKRPGEIFQSTKNFMTKTGKFASKLGKASTALSFVAAGFDVLDDGKVSSSTILNVGLLTVGLVVPVTAPFIFAYGLADYAFDIGGKVDDKFGEINTHIYD